MGDSEENKNESNEKFDLDSELSALVENNVIPSKIAEKLGKKLKEQNVNISKDQLRNLINKINTIMKTHQKVDSKEKTSATKATPQTTPIKDDQNMQKLIETIEKMELRLTNIEKGFKTGDKRWNKSSSKIVTTGDIRIPEGITSTTDWEWDPLTEIPSDPESIVVLMKWLQYLIDKCGRDNLSNILDYYVDIDWITQDAKINLIDYSQGITDEGNKGEDFSQKNISDLPSRDHIQSLIYIQKLKGIQVDKHFIDKIDGELSRITKKLDNYNFK